MSSNSRWLQRRSLLGFPSRRGRVLLLFIFLSATNSGFAAMAPKFYEQARQQAPIHAQVEIESVEIAQPSSFRQHFGLDACVIQGKIAQLFRDTTNTLTINQPISFPVDCIVDENAQVPIGGTFYIALDRLKNAKVLEVYLAHKDDEFQVVASQVTLLSAPTSSPACPADSKGFGC